MQVDVTAILTFASRITNKTTKTFRYKKYATSVMSYSIFQSCHIVINIARMTLKPQLSELCMSTCRIHLQQVV